MSYKGLSIQSLGEILPTDIRAFLRGSGWQRGQDLKPRKIALFEKGDAQLQVPQDTDFTDYAMRVGDIVFAVAEDEKRKPLEILKDLMTSACDVVRMAVEGGSTISGTIPLADGIGLLTGTEKALLASACQVSHPSRFHARLKSPEGEKFLKRCKLGQTEQGSFVASVVCPVDDDGQIEFDGMKKEPSSFSRRVTTKLLEGLDTLVSALDQDDLTPITKATNEEAIVSANLCDALLEMRQEKPDSGITFSVNWSRNTPAPEGVSRRIRIRSDYFPNIEKIAKELRPSQEPEADLFFGRIDQLMGISGPDGRMQGDIVLRFVHEEEEAVRARIDLNADLYSQACDAHKLGKYVRVSGTLHRQARKGRITDITEFKVVDKG